jgi:hypothetical protein
MTRHRFGWLALALALAWTAPAQTIVSISPSQVEAGSGSFTLTVSGRGFTQATGCAAPVILWVVGQTEIPLTPTTVGGNGTVATATVPAYLVAQPSTQPITVKLRIQTMSIPVPPNYQQGCVSSDSNAAPFQILAQAKPIITSYSPTEATACGPDFTLGVTGSGFLPGVQLGIGGPEVYNRLSTTFYSSTSLAGTVTRDQIATPGGVNIVAGNPAASGAGYVFSDPRPFNIRRTPTIRALSPARAVVGSADLRVTVTGADFVAGVTRVLWQAGTATEALIPVPASRTEMSVTVPQRLLAAVGRAVVRVVNVEPANTRGEPYSDTCSPPVTFPVEPVALQLDDVQLPPGKVGVDYRATFTASGGTRAYSFSLASGSVPGLTLSADGVLSGRPTQAGTYSLRVQVTDSSSPQQRAQRDFSLRIDPPTLQVASPDTLPEGRVGADYRASFTATGGTSPYKWGLASGSNGVPGLSLNADGSLTGRPTTAGAFTLRVQVTDSSSPPQLAQRDYTLRINVSDLAVASPNIAALPPATVGTAYSETFTASGGTGPYGWDLQSGSVPGLALTSGGVLSGNPTANGNFTLVVRVTDANSVQATRQYTLSVGLAAAGLTLTVPTPPTSPTDQPAVVLRVVSAYPVALEGRLSLAFTPDAAGLPAAGYVDPAVKFAAGGTTLSFSIAANSTTVTLPGNGAVQTGTVAGTITVTLDQLRLAGTTTDVPLASRPTATIAVARAAPVIVAGSVQITGVSATGFAVELDAYSTPRDLGTAAFSFTAASGARLDGAATFSVPLAQESAAWFASADGRANGSRFHLRVPFTLSGSTTALGTVSVTLGNSAGASSPVSGGVR